MAQAGDVLVNRYTLLDRLGAGAAAEVWRANDQRLGRPVAIKILRPEFVGNAEAQARFEGEARAAAALTHPNVVDVYDYGAVDNTVFIAMQYIDGEDLKRYIARRGQLDPREAARIALAVAHGLAAAHAHGLIHRDIKPQNILIDHNGGVRITDFGIAKALGGPNLTQQGMTYGTAAYLSPEQATGQPVGPASDVYALGIVLYEMLCGAAPFQGDNVAAVAYQQVYQAPPSLRACNPAVPERLEGIVSRALEKLPALRYPTADALASDLNAFLATAERTTPGYLPVVPPTPALPLYVPPPPANSPPPAAAPPPMMLPPDPLGTMDLTARQASLTAEPVAPPQRRGVALWMALPALVLLLLVCGAGALGSGLVHVNLGPGLSDTPVPTLAAGGLPAPSPTTPAPTRTAAPQATEPSAPTEPPAATELPATELPAATEPPATEPPAPTEPPAATEPPATASPVPPVLATPIVPPSPVPPTATGSIPGRPIFLTPTPPTATNRTVLLEDVAFAGGYRYPPSRLYEGRTAVWVYAPGTGFETMTAPFIVAGTPGGQAVLTLVGMDSEGAAKTPLRILLNGQAIYSGPDPLPNDFTPNAGSWGQADIPFDASILHPGANTLTIENRATSGKVGGPPFIMVDTAQLRWANEQ